MENQRRRVFKRSPLKTRENDATKNFETIQARYLGQSIRWNREKGVSLFRPRRGRGQPTERVAATTAVPGHHRPGVGRWQKRRSLEKIKGFQGSHWRDPGHPVTYSKKKKKNTPSPSPPAQYRRLKFEATG